MKRAAEILAATLVLGAAAWVAAAQEAEDPEQREQTVRATVRAFWTAFVHGDADAFRAEIDFPLTLQEQGSGDQGGGRFIIDEAGWPDFRSSFPLQPLRPDEATVALSSVRLEWLGSETCLATFDLAADIEGGRVEGRYMALVVRTDGWRIAVATIPM